jgi:chaperonin GroEL (HSP60 family)
MTSELTDAKKAGLLEPLAVKRAAMISAVETAVSLLRIDRITAASKFKAAPKGREG